MSSLLFAGCQTNAWPIDASDPATLHAALHQIARLEYGGFETSFRYLNALVREDRRPADMHGLQFFGVHIFIAEYDAATAVAPRDLVVEVLALASRLGAQNLILSGGPSQGFAQLRAKADALKRLAELSAKVGVRLCYHNHAPELLAQPEQPSEFETLLGETSDSPLGFVLDAGHAYRAGLPVASFAARLHRRIAAIHLRDFRGEEQVPLGTGDFPLSGVAAALREAGWRGWLFAEEERADGSKPGYAAVSAAREALRNTFGI